MNAEEAVMLATELALHHRVRIKKVGPGPDDFDVVTLDDSPSKESQEELAKSIAERLDRVEVLAEKAQPPPGKVESLKKIAKVLDKYVRKVESQRGHHDTSVTTEFALVHSNLKAVSNLVGELIREEQAGPSIGDDRLRLDLYYRASKIAGELASKLKKGKS